MNKLDHQTTAALLTEAHPWQKFAFGSKVGTETWGWRYLMSCILVAGSRETKIIACGKELFAKYEGLFALQHASWRELTDLIEKYEIRFAGKKATSLIATADILCMTHNGRVPDDRAKLEKLPGVGRHVASVILATVYDQNEFAVDVHVRRIAKRLGLADEKASDRRIENIIVKAVKPEMLGHFSRSFVDFGQQVCSYSPKCGQCFLAEQCPSVNQKPVKKQKREATTVEKGVSIIEGVFEFENDRGFTYIVTVKDSKAHCTCKGWRFKKKCKHVDAVDEFGENAHTIKYL